jgi:3-hydroxyacyl-CoA dehydrogenase
MDRLAILRMHHPPVNSLGLEHRRAILTALDEANQDAEVKAILLTGSGKGFSAGADINEFGTDLAEAEPNLRTVIAALTSSCKPVIAAIHGVCMGGGLELALGCHYRIARPDAQIALPEVKLGLLPGAGGTQRMPPLVGFERAINMITSGATVHASELADTALFDRIGDDVFTVALQFAEEILNDDRAEADRPELRNARAEDEGLLQFARARAAERHKDKPAVAACIEAVRAAVDLPLDQGLERERELFGALLQTPQSRALRHAFLAERQAAKVPGIAVDQATRAIGSAAVVGAGTMGVGIAMCFINAGIPVTILDQSAGVLGKARERIADIYESAVARGKLSPVARQERLALLATESDYTALADADIVVEAVFEDLATKAAVFQDLDTIVRQGAILATNTSTLDVNRIAAATKRPQDVIGLHFFSPAHVMRLLEIVRGDKTSTETLATAVTLAKRLSKVGVVSGVCDGFIGNRMVEQYLRQAFFLLDEGALPQQVDGALEAWGFAMGPFRMSDLAGNDIGWHIRKRRYAEQPEMIYSKIADILCEHERFGQKVGRGWYRYEAGKRTAIPDPKVTRLVLAHAASLGVAPRKIGDSEIVERCVLALVNEGAQILEEGIAARASDIDVVYLAGYGFPSHRGGPMWFASEQGLFNVERTMLRLARNPHGDPGFWMPSPLITRLAQRSGRFE